MQVRTVEGSLGRELASPVIGSAAARTLLTRLWSLESAPALDW